MSAIIAPNGSPLNTAIIGVDDLDLSLEFYRDLIGLSTEDPFDWSGKEFFANLRIAMLEGFYCLILKHTKRS